jgi:hypothetical protein
VTVILVPINYTGGANILDPKDRNTQSKTSGLQIYSISNIHYTKYNRIWAHCMLAICVIVWTCWVILDELKVFVRIRQGYLASPQHRLRASASTVLVQSLPKRYIDKKELEALFDVFPGGIRNIWLNRDYSSLRKLIKLRKNMSKELEKAEADLIKKCFVRQSKRQSKKSNRTSSHALDDLDEAGKRTSTHALDGLDGTGSGSPQGDKDWSGINANDPKQVYHTVEEQIAALRRAEQPLVTNPGRTPLGRLAQGVQNMAGKVMGNKRRPKKNRPGTSDSQPGSEQNDGTEAGSPPRDSDDRYTDSILPEDGPEQALPENGSPRTSLQGLSASASIEREEKAEPLAYNPEFEDEHGLQPRWQEFIKPTERPSKRLKTRMTWLPWWLNPWNQKVDKIYYLRKELATLNKMIEERQSPVWQDQDPALPSAFIQFNNQTAAHMACQAIAHHVPKYISPRLVEVAPNDIIWENMAVTWIGSAVRTVLVGLLIVALIFLWTMPIIVLGVIAQLPPSFKEIKGLRWIQKIPTVLFAIIQGPIAVLLVLLLVFLLGLVLRSVIKLQGSPTRVQVELSVQKWFFAFTFIQVWLSSASC